MDATIRQGLSASPQARAIRQQVFVEEQGFTLEFDEIDDTAWHLLLWDGEQAIATGRTFPKEGEGGCWLIGRVAVLVSHRGQHLGRKILAHLEGQIRAQGGSRAELSAQVQAQGFYEKQGYRSLGDIHMDEHCPHVTMVKDV